MSIGSDDVKIRLKERWAYLHLANALLPELFREDEARTVLSEVATFIDTASPSALQRRAPALIPWLNRAVELTNKRLCPLKPWEQIAADYWSLSSARQLSSQRGIRHGWLAQRFDLRRALGVPDDFPLHAQIGIGPHAGSAAVEEDFILRDSFYLLAKVRQQFGFLRDLVAKGGAAPDFGRASAVLAHNVAAFARLTVKSFHAFLECFVNSVGEDFIARNDGLGPADVECLHGRKRGKYLRLTAKIERFPGVIRSDRRRPIVLSDPGQIREPFVALRRITDVRDAAMHYAPQKEDIWRSPQEWTELTESAASTYLACAREFWTACYPTRSQPLYLFELDESRHLGLAKERLELEAQSYCCLDQSSVPG